MANHSRVALAKELSGGGRGLRRWLWLRFS